MKNLPKIYCDMDGVLCDFKSYAEKIVGVPINKWMNLSKVDKWKPIVDKGDFWSTMPWHTGVKNSGHLSRSIILIFYLLM